MGASPREPVRLLLTGDEGSSFKSKAVHCSGGLTSRCS